jgi:CubicO group peptidase (beta-lactamase class C family)
MSSSSRDRKNSESEEIISNQKLKKLMQDAFIPGLSVAFISPDKKIETHAVGVTNLELKSPITPETQFWACSLSKPLFTYLVIKLIQEKQLGEGFGLDTPLPWDESVLGLQEDKKSFTVKMILSHMTGLPNQGVVLKDDPIFKGFKPGELFRYSGEGYGYLQKIIKKHTGKDLNTLAKEFIFDRLGMTRSSFLYPEKEKNLAHSHSEAMEPNLLPKIYGNDDHSAASLHTTSSDYACFLMACLQDEEFIKLIKIPYVESMVKDIDAKADKEILNPIAWGMGFGLQKDKRGRPAIAFHWGHGPGARGFFAMNLENPKSAMVYFANSENGLAVAEYLSNLTVGDIRPAMNYLSSKYGYKQIHSPNWEIYHEHLMTGVAAEKSGDFKTAASAYEKANMIRPGNELQHSILWCNVNKIVANPDLDFLQKFNGQYGPVKIFIENSKIKIKTGETARDLKYVGDNIFLNIDERVILKFDINAKPALTCFFSWGGKPVFDRMLEAKEALATTAHIAGALSIPDEKLLVASSDNDKQKAVIIIDEESILSSPQRSSSENSKDKVEISDEDRARSAVEQSSDVAPGIARKLS